MFRKPVAAEKNAVVRSRPHPAFWLALLFPVGINVLASADKTTTGLLRVFVFVFSLGIAPPIVAWIVSGETIADADGLRWRRWRTWRSVPWYEVTDYYIGAKGKYGRTIPTAAQRANSGALSANFPPIVLLRDGTKVELAGDWHNASRLRDAVKARAAATETNDWLPLGTRNADFPQTFRYLPESLRKMRQGVLAYTIFIGTIVTGLAYVSFFVTDSRTGENSHALLILVLLYGGMGFLVCREELLTIKKMTARLGEEWVIEREGFHFQAKDGETVAISWSQVVGYDFPQNITALSADPKPYALRTDDGLLFTYEATLDGSRLLTQIIRDRAVNGVESRIAYNTKDALGGIRARWTGGVEGVGDRVYHARTRSNFGWIRIAALVPALQTGSLVFLVLKWQLSYQTDPRFFITTAAIDTLFLMIVLLSLTLIFLVKVIVGKSALTWQGPFWKRTVAWGNIRSHKTNLSGNLTLEIDGDKPLTLPLHRLAYGSELGSLVEERVARAA